MAVTTRFSLAELSEMLHVPVDAVRFAVNELKKESQLTAESFLFAERNWRIAPSDVKRIQAYISQAVEEGRLQIQVPARKIKKKQILLMDPLPNKETT